MESSRDSSWVFTGRRKGRPLSIVDWWRIISPNMIAFFITSKRQWNMAVFQIHYALRLNGKILDKCEWTVHCVFSIRPSVHSLVKNRAKSCVKCWFPGDLHENSYGFTFTHIVRNPKRWDDLIDNTKNYNGFWRWYINVHIHFGWVAAEVWKIMMAGWLRGPRSMSCPSAV